MTDAEKVTRLVRIAPRVIDRAYRRYGSSPVPGNECTKMGVIAHETLRRLGVASEPLDCFATRWNASFNAWLKSGKSGGDYPADAHRYTNDPRVLLQAGVQTLPDDLLSHVVVFVPSTSQILDLAAFQMSRPDKGIQLPGALALPWDGEKALFESPTGWVGYRPCPEMLRPPPFDVRPEWLKELQPTKFLAKILAKKVAKAGGHHD